MIVNQIVIQSKETEIVNKNEQNKNCGRMLFFIDVFIFTYLYDLLQTVHLNLPDVFINFSIHTLCTNVLHEHMLVTKSPGCMHMKHKLSFVSSS